MNNVHAELFVVLFLLFDSTNYTYTLLYMYLILLTVASNSVVDDTCNIFLVADFYGYCDIDNVS